MLASSGRRWAKRWQAASTSDAVAAGDAALFMDGRFLRSVAADDGIGRWSLELPATLAYPQLLQGDHLYLLGASSLGSVNVKTRALEWVVPLESAPTAGIAAADDTLYFTTQSTSGNYVFHAFDPATQKFETSSPFTEMSGLRGRASRLVFSSLWNAS